MLDIAPDNLRLEAKCEFDAVGGVHVEHLDFAGHAFETELG